MEDVMEVQELLGALFNVLLVVVIMSAMLSAGFTTTFATLGAVLSRVGLVLMVLFTGLVIRPLIGWGTAELFGLAVPAFIALVIVSSVPGAPLGVIFAMKAKADVATAATFQVLLALVGSFTFAPTANWIIEAADLGEEISLPVADLIKTIAFLQILPFVVGLLIRHWNEKGALEWNEFAKKITGPGLLAIVALALLGSWQMIIDLIGARVLFAGVVFTVAMIALGYFISEGDRPTRAATALIEPNANAGPALAAVAIAFNNDPEILGAMTALLLMGLVITGPIGTWLGKDQADEGEGGQEARGEDSLTEETGSG
jgi:BASS family bile acid:Na+ symporter